MNLKYIKRNHTFGEILRDIAHEHPDREAIVFEDQRVTFAQLIGRVERLAVGFQAMGIGLGDNVAVILPNCPEYLYVVGALGYIGAAAVPLSVQSGIQDMGYILNDSEAIAVVTALKAYGTNLLALLDELRPSLPHLKNIIIKGDGDDSASLEVEVGKQTLNSLLDTVVDTSALEPVDDPATSAMILYTSGTTGMPKGAVHSHRTLLMGVHLLVGKLTEGMDPSWDLVKSAIPTIKTVRRIPWFIEVVLAVLDRRQIKLLLLTPFYHIAGYFQLLLVLLTGGRIVIMERFHPQKALELIQKERVTLVFGVPPMFSAMMSHPDFSKYDLSSLILSVTGAMPVPPQVIRDMKKKIGGFVMIVYGTTEIAGGMVTWASDPEDKQAETVGRADLMEDLEIKIVDEGRQEIPHGKVGEIVVRAPSLMEGYYKRPDATAEALDKDGWYYTGDLGMIDEDGYVVVMGRRGDMIIRGGANIYPAEIENYLLAHPKINQVAVIGIPGESGDNVRAYIVLEPGESMQVGDVIAYCRGQIAAYKVPEEVVFVDSLPVTSALQKVQHYKLRQQALIEKNIDISGKPIL
jgi:fatty-acyl-CoA synthase